MKKIGKLLNVLMFSALILPITTRTYGAGMNVPDYLKDVKVEDTIDSNDEIIPTVAVGDVFMNYKKYQGKSIYFSNYTVRQKNGDMYYYKGTMSYVGREREFIIGGIGLGDYIYKGRLGYSLKLYKVVRANGEVYYPYSIWFN